MTVVLFCGGRGVRLRADAPDVPKPLVPIGDAPILEHLMRWYAHHGHREFVLCLGSGGKAIERHFLHSQGRIDTGDPPGDGAPVQLRTNGFGTWTIRLARTGESAGIGERLRRVRRLIAGPIFLANYADGLSDLDLPGFVARFVESAALAGLITVRPPGSFHAVSTGSEGVVRGIVPIRDSGIRVNGGFFAFRVAALDRLRPGEDLATGLFPRLVSEGALFGHAHDGFWACMDTAEDWRRLQGLASTGRPPWAVWQTSGTAGAGSGAAPTSAEAEVPAT